MTNAAAGVGHEEPRVHMPHGSKWNHAGTRVYVACMMSDELLTIDPAAFS